MEYLYSYIECDHHEGEDQITTIESNNIKGIIKKKSKLNVTTKESTKCSNNLLPNKLLRKNTKENRYSNIGKINSIYNIRDPRERTRIANNKLNEISDSADKLKIALDDASTYDDIVAKSIRNIKYNAKEKIKTKTNHKSSNLSTSLFYPKNKSYNKMDNSIIDDIDRLLNTSKCNSKTSKSYDRSMQYSSFTDFDNEHSYLDVDGQQSIMSILTFCLEDISPSSKICSKSNVRKRKVSHIYVLYN